MNTLDLDLVQSRAAAGDAEAQYVLGRQYAGRGQFSRARRWLRAAADQGHAGALTELGLFELFAIGTPTDIAAATRLLTLAEAAGSPEAAYQLAVIGWCLKDVPFDLDSLSDRLLRSALGGFPQGLRAIALVYARTGGDAEAFVEPCLEQAVAQGDSLSAYLLALRLLDRGDSERARSYAATALARGVGRASIVEGASAATPAAPAIAPLSDLPRPGLRDPIDCPRQRHSDRPFIETIDGVLSPLECEFVIALGEPYLDRSVTLDDKGQLLSHSSYRSSSEMAFYSFQEDYALRWLQWRMVDLAGAPLSHAEHTVLLRYLPGQEYRPHRDYLPPSSPGNGDTPDVPGQRVNTVFCYLNDVEEGGETAFPLQQIKIKPRKGRVVFFKNLLANGLPDSTTLHAGMPVVRGEKWLATLWTRQRRFRTY